MYERYHIPLKTVEPRAQRVPKFTINRADNCVNCGRCERACVFGVHVRSKADPRTMADPLSHLCKNCFRCIAECPQGALTMSRGAEYRSLGRGIWTPLRISTIWGEAETGKIPVLGAGYRGMFAGPGYDGMWTDMSEIVRPTRDGIHGREVISTSVDIGRIPPFLEFDSSGAVTTDMPPLIDIPIPMTLDLMRMRTCSKSMAEGFLTAAKRLRTFAFVPVDLVSRQTLADLGETAVPVVPARADLSTVDIPDDVRMVELAAGTAWKNDHKALVKKFPDKIVSIRMGAVEGIEDTVLEMLERDVAVAHVQFSDEGRETSARDRHAKDSLRAIHRKLVEVGRRDEITVMAGGGLAAAEHVPKSIICGADAVSMSKALLIALECRDCLKCNSPSECPVNVSSAPASWVTDRVMNVVGAWRDQLLEVLGAMGLREVRRLRGEFGRAIFFDDLEAGFASPQEGGEDG
jgi:ferredoxin